MAKIIWTYEAEQWLKDIYEYIALDNPNSAIDLINEIYNKTQILLNQPKIGYLYSHESNKEIRILLYGHYRITYYLSKKNVVILGVFHGALQIENYMLI